jgi:hypothetical protein
MDAKDAKKRSILKQKMSSGQSQIYEYKEHIGRIVIINFKMALARHS